MGKVLKTLRMYSGKMDRRRRSAMNDVRREGVQMLSVCELWRERLMRGFTRRRAGTLPCMVSLALPISEKKDSNDRRCDM